ncbi:nuclear transport factor 2 family protein [Parasphingopyxis marina]|uniref:Nuclear transport factor 2 family protein n=1 Tax=Parasphingopyxis marina TaxID=2761622 RepID=A0A842I2I2_9SPHN|nr:nuclear transport factor 2 family protein [Parasphingopyxis marina]MBC2778939.1 nuclear transport factor 2 family protein [Parasphingopyxis marina]
MGDQAMHPAERLLIERSCERLQARYAQTADNGDIEGFVELFVENGSVEVPEHRAFVGHASIRESIRALAATGLTMRHVITNRLVTVIDETHAQGSCYLTVYNSDAEPDASGIRPAGLPATIGEYADRFTKTDAGWRFQSRVLKRVFRG